MDRSRVARGGEAMKIWVDLATAPQVLFRQPLIAEIKKVLTVESIDRLLFEEL